MNRLHYFSIPLGIVLIIVAMIFYPYFASIIYQEYLNINATVPEGYTLLYDAPLNPSVILIVASILLIINSIIHFKTNTGEITHEHISH